MQSLNSEHKTPCNRSPMGDSPGSSSLLEDSIIQGQFFFESIRLFEKRFANGYDIYTDHEYNNYYNYVAWLEQHYPECLPSFESIFPKLDSPYTSECAMDPFHTVCNTGEHL